MTNKNKKFVILGAGPVGLVTGYFLAKQKFNVEIYEMQNQVGGMCRTWKWRDFYVDTGPHIFHTSDKDLWKLWQKLFKNNLIEGVYRSKNIFGKNFENMVDYPLSKEAINKFPNNEKKKILKELRDAKNNKVKYTSNFKEHVISQVGPTLQKLFFEGYPEKVWGIETSKMTSEWAPKRIKFTDKTLPFFHKERTGVGKLGTGQLYEMIKDEILKNNGKIFLDHKVIKIRQEENIINTIEFSNKKKISINKNDTLISSLPINLAAKFLGHSSNLQYRGVRSIYISVKKERCLPKKVNWVYFSDKSILFNRVSEPKTMSKFISPKNITYLTAEITYSKGDKIDKINLNKLKKIIIENLIKTKLIKNKSDILDISENKEDIVYPIQFVNYKQTLAKTKSFISKFSQLYSLGTGGDFDYADSQILFHKSMDLVKILTDKYNQITNVRKMTNNVKLNSVVQLGKKKVGSGNRPFIIAEAGLNHNGDLNIAKKLIDNAAECKCDAIKFQTFQKDGRVSGAVKSVNYTEKADGLREDINEMFNRLKMSHEFHQKIFSYAKKKKITIFSTPFDEKSVDYLEKLNVQLYKIASVDAINLPLIYKVGLTGKPLILSTGMCDIGNVNDAIKTFKSSGNKNLILLHCLSSYPADEKEMNLKSIDTMKKIYNIPVGLSDHYPGIEVSILSLGMGADIIERHFTLSKKLEGPDHILSSEKDEMHKLVNIAHNRNSILGSGEKIIQPSEYEVINSQRKSLYAKKNIKKNEKFSLENISIKGPAGGILPKYIDIIIGKRSKSKVLKDQPISWEII
jgi:sialic acid synthase SpsE/protoporphyrinogen oxidase